MVQIVRYFLKLKYDRTGSMRVDDIDHLANRRIRAVGELVENGFRIGLMRLEKIIRERITNSPDISVVLPRELLNTKPVFAALKEFFGTSQLSQFMDQTNALAETTHKRRISALGPGGLNRERAGFEVRDVHSSHYGRICPIETPEGPNIGLISSLTTYARVNDYGFIETPYRKVENGQVVDYCRVEYAGDSKFAYHDIVREHEAKSEMARLQKGREKAAHDQLPSLLPDRLGRGRVHHRPGQRRAGRQGPPGLQEGRCPQGRGETMQVDPLEVNFMDISPKQIVSISAALIPFLENDDANRALMGSNMQRQAVPLINPEAAIVATGMEHRLIKDSGMVIVCRRSGVVMNADAERIIVRVDADNADENNFSEIQADLYELQKFRRSNQNTIINQRPLVKVGERVEKGQILCDGPASDKGELAMGRNILAAFVPWRGYNYEDAIILSETAGQEFGLQFHLHRRGDHRGPRDQAGPRGDHPRHPQRFRDRPEEPRRERHRAHRRQGQARRDPGRQGVAQGGNAALSRGKAPARHLRRAGLGDQGFLPVLPPGRGGNGDRRQGLHPPRPEQGQARQRDRPHRDRQDGAEFRRRKEDPARREIPEDRQAAAQGKAGQEPQLRQEEIRKGQAHPGQGPGADGRRFSEGNQEIHRR